MKNKKLNYVLSLFSTYGIRPLPRLCTIAQYQSPASLTDCPDDVFCFTLALWSIIEKNTDCSTGPLARPFARSLARSLCSLPRSWESEFLMSQNDLVLSHSAMINGLERHESWRSMSPSDSYRSTNCWK